MISFSTKKEEKEKIGVRELDCERERERERERKLILGVRNALKTQSFRLEFLLFFSSHLAVSHSCPRRV